MGERDRDMQRTRFSAFGAHLQLVRNSYPPAIRVSNVCSLWYSERLAEIMRHQAALLEHIITNQRYYPDYFRVAFYGNFPVAIRNKQFIVRLEIRHCSGVDADDTC